MDDVSVDAAAGHCVVADDNSDSHVVSSEPVGVEHELPWLVG